MTAKERLLEALTAEQFNGGGWATPEREPVHAEADDDLAPARRLRALKAEFAAHEHRLPETTRGLA